MTVLDDLHAAMVAGGDVDGLAFYRALADAELFLLLVAEAKGEVVEPRVFELADGPVVLAFDSEERLAAFGDGPLAYAALPGRVVALQMAGKRLALGLNLGAVSEMILPPEALDWLVAMLDQAVPEPVEARVAAFEPPQVPEAVVAGLRSVLGGARGLLVSARYRGGGRRQMLALVGVAEADHPRLARAVTEVLAFSGLEAGSLDVVFLGEGDAALAKMAAVAAVIEGAAPSPREPDGPRLGPGMDSKRPPVLK